MLAAWLAVAVLFGAQQAALEGGLTTDILLGVLLYDGLWAAATLAVLSLLRQRPAMVEQALGRRVLVHLGLSLGVTLVVLTLYALGARALGLEDVGGPLATLQANLLSGLVTYGLMLAALMTLEQRRLAARRRETRAALEHALVEARAALLRSQLQPHFLFNALNTLAGLIPDDPAAAETMAVRLGDFLRLSLETREPMVPLARELQTLDAYLAVQGPRFGDRLRVEKAIAPDALSVLVPDLLLQPIVENAIRHGLAPRPEGGAIRLRARKVDERLELVVSDEGVGADATLLTEGLGLGITRERLALPEGTAAGTMAVETAPGRGFTVTLHLPWRTG